MLSQHHAGQFNVMVVADADAYPDLEVFAAGVEDELRAVAAAVTPSRPRHDERRRGAAR